MNVKVLLFSLFVSVFLKESDSFAFSHGEPERYRNLDFKNMQPLDHTQYTQCRHEICTSVKMYPEEEIRKAMKDKILLEKLFGNVLNSTYIYDIENRFGGDSSKSTQLCDIEGPNSYKPMVLRNMDTKWKFIVNIDNYPQHFTSEICRHPENLRTEIYVNGRCRDLNFKCKQDYQPIYLLTFENGIIEFDRFLIPTTCSCVCD